MAAPGEAQSAEASCQSLLSHLAQSDDPTTSSSPVLSDTRGPFTLFVYSSGGIGATCVIGPSVSLASSTPDTDLPAAGQVAATDSAYGDDKGNSFSVSIGQTGSGVTGVTLVLDDGTDVVASTGNGWYSAWWPGISGIQSVEVTTASGTATEPGLPDPPLPSGKVGNDSGGWVSYASSGGKGAGQGSRIGIVGRSSAQG